MMSFGIAMAAYTAQNYGAKKIARIKKGVNQCILMSGSFSILVGIFNIVFGPEIMELFVGEGEPEVVALGQIYLVTTSICYLVLALLFIYRMASPAAWIGSCVPLAIAYYYTLRRLKTNIREIKGR